ncbi:MAG: Uma2 family endonuclease, partial [Spirochaetaceae bacterium]|nr:Uma2 family endonuclease [Spirochaetaceae bacterium]
YGDYRRWPEDERWELIDGVAYLMGAPTVSHQRIVRYFLLALSAFLDGKECEVFLSPLDVLSFAPGEREEDECSTVVQPDLFVLCDKVGLNDKNLHGLPELVVEVLSPSTSRKDQHEKFALYERGGVKEYWVVDPEGGWICLYARSAEGKLKESALRERWGNRSPLASTCLPGFTLAYESLFERPA